MGSQKVRQKRRTTAGRERSKKLGVPRGPMTTNHRVEQREELSNYREGKKGKELERCGPRNSSEERIDKWGMKTWVKKQRERSNKPGEGRIPFTAICTTLFNQGGKGEEHRSLIVVALLVLLWGVAGMGVVVWEERRWRADAVWPRRTGSVVVSRPVCGRGACCVWLVAANLVTEADGHCGRERKKKTSA